MTTPPSHQAHKAATTAASASRPTTEELIMFLERDQLVADTSQPVARAHLGPRANVALWGLRGFVLVVSFMVIYTFLHQL